MFAERIALTFWGVRVDVEVLCEEDVARLRYYFRDYLVGREPRRADMTLRLSARGTPFCSDRYDVERHVELWSDVDGWTTYERYTGDPVMPSLLPPFFASPLRERVKIVHGAAVSPPNRPDQGLVIAGPSTSGKSSLLLGLLERGWRFVTDDIVVVESGRTLLRYTRPIGVRSSTFTRARSFGDAIRAAPRFATSTGWTAAVHPRDLSVGMAPERVNWRWTVALEKHISFACTTMSERTMRLAWSVDRDWGQGLPEVESLVAM